MSAIRSTSRGERRQLKALLAQVDNGHYAFLATYIMLPGNVVNALIAQAGYRA
jgi:hypothetical protein